MATTVVKTIGTGGDYSLPQPWEDACPVNLVTNDEIWQGQLKKQAFTAALAVGGMTTDATRYVELKCEAGASFSDNPNAQTNALRWDSANGASFSVNNNYSPTIDIANVITFRMSGVQARNQGSGQSFRTGVNTAAMRLDRCIFETAGGTGGAVWTSGSGVVLSNSLCMTRAAAPTRIVKINQGMLTVGCTFVATQAAASFLTDTWYAVASLINCAVMNVTAVSPTTVTATTCFTSMTSPPTGFTNTAYSTSTGAMFENITNGTHDYRIKSGSSLISVGTTSPTYGTPDIVGTPRPQGAAYDVGAWEYKSAGIVPPTLLAASATSITTSSAIPRVTFTRP